jgi:hypothetical protein
MLLMLAAARVGVELVEHQFNANSGSNQQTNTPAVYQLFVQRHLKMSK